MPQRIRLGTVTNGSLDSTDATIEIDGDDLYITVENGDVRTDGTVAFEDATADPSANGEIQRNGADLKAYSGGAVRNLTSPTFESVTTVEAVIGSHDTIKGVEAGSATVSAPSAASDDGWDTNNQEETTVNFSTSFGSAPKVFVTANDAGPTGNPQFFGQFAVQEVTTSQFTLNFTMFGTASIDSVGAYWIAIET